MCSEGDENHQVACRKQNKPDLTTGKICVPLVPVEYVDYIYWLSENILLVMIVTAGYLTCSIAYLIYSTSQ